MGSFTFKGFYIMSYRSFRYLSLFFTLKVSKKISCRPTSFYFFGQTASAMSMTDEVIPLVNRVLDDLA